MISCTGLFNTANAQWGCRGMLAVSNALCENTALNGETAGASIKLIDRYPFLTASLTPNSPVPVSYCTGAVLTLRVTNSVSGPTGGEARNIRFIPTLPPGYTLSGTNVQTNVVVIGDLAPGATTNVTLTLQAGGRLPPVPGRAVPLFAGPVYRPLRQPLCLGVRQRLHHPDQYSRGQRGQGHADLRQYVRRQLPGYRPLLLFQPGQHHGHHHRPVSNQHEFDPDQCDGGRGVEHQPQPDHLGAHPEWVRRLHRPLRDVDPRQLHLDWLRRAQHDHCAATSWTAKAAPAPWPAAA